MTPEQVRDGILDEVAAACESLEVREGITRMAERLRLVRPRGGRVFVLGVGGSAANASHCVNDLRKIARIEAYAPTDNVAEITARTNDDGWNTVFVEWLRQEDIGSLDALLVLSVGGGSETTSRCITEAVKFAAEWGCAVLGIVSRDGGETLKHATACVHIQPNDESLTTPVAEAMQAVVWHCVVNMLREA